MAYPAVSIALLNGQIAVAEASADGTSGMVIGADVGANGIVAGTVYSGREYQDFKTLGFDDIAFANRHIDEFYSLAPVGTLLYVMIAPDTVEMADICDKAAITPYLLNLKNYDTNIKLMGVARLPDGAYVPAVTKGLDDDVIAAIVNAQALSGDFVTYRPHRTVVEAREYQGVIGTLEDLRAASYQRCAATICSSEAALSGTPAVHDKSAALGLTLGALAAIPPQRKISRVKSGALPITAAYVYDESNTPKYQSVEDIDVEAMHDKGYITIRVHKTRSGYYFGGDPAATASTDDYKNLSLGRVVDKAIPIIYDTLVEELDDDVQVDAETGYLPTPVIKYYQGRIETAVLNAMADNLSGFQAYIDPLQDIITAAKLIIKCTIVPVGYTSGFEVTLAFDNPATA